MTTAHEPEITDELLSAYIDDAVTDDERHLIARAVMEDPEVAWRLASLRATVHLLHELPALALPRSFVLTPEQLGQRAAQPAAAGVVAAELAARRGGTQLTVPLESGFWQRLASGWQTFWRSGSPALRNAMAASLALLLVLLVTPRFVAPGTVETLTTSATVTEPQARDEVLPAPTSAITVIPEPVAPVAAMVAPTVEELNSEPLSASTGLDAEESESLAFSDTAPTEVPVAEVPVPDMMAAAAPAASAFEATGGGTGAVDQSPSAGASFPAAGARTTLSSAVAPEAAAAPAVAAQAMPPALAAAPAAPVPAGESPEADAASAPPLAKAVVPAPVAEAPTLAAAATEAPTAVAPTATEAVVVVAATVAAEVPATTTTTPAPSVTPAVVAAVQPEAQAAPVTAVSDAITTPPAVWLPIAQLGVALATLTFGLLWWRSRRR